MVKTLLVISKYLPEYTGAAYRLHNLYKRSEISNLSQNVEVLCNSTSETFSETYHYDGVKVRRVVFPWQLLWLPSRFRNAIKVYYEAFFSFIYIFQKKPKTLHIVGYSGATIAALIYGRLNNIPRLIELVTREATPFQYLPGFRYPKFLRLERQTIIVAISSEIEERCNLLGIKTNVWLRPNPIDETRFNPCANSEKLKYRLMICPFRKDDIVIAMVAKFMPQKNQIFLLEVLKELPERFKLLLGGPQVNSGLFKTRDSSYFSEILAKMKINSLEKRVHIQIGFVDAANYMKACDIYAMPQHTEGFGTPMFEAMATGKPIIANKDEPEFQRWIKDGNNGSLSPMNAKIWAKNIQKAIKLPEWKLEIASRNILSVASMAETERSYKKIFIALQLSRSGQKLCVDEII